MIAVSRDAIIAGNRMEVPTRRPAFAQNNGTVHDLAGIGTSGNKSGLFR